MLLYFDKLFANLYYWYISNLEKDVPILYSVLLLSLFQTFNALSLIFFIGGIFYRENWEFTGLEVLGVGIIVITLDYIRIYKIVGLKTLLNRFETAESRKSKLHPVLYIIITFLLFGFVRFIGFFPMKG